MPIFEFRCSACGHLEEVLQKHTDPAPDPCPKCGVQKTMGKEISAAAFHLKGGGWYKDLYASSSTTAPAAEAKGDAKSETTAETKSESKAAEPKAEAKTDVKTERATTTTAAPAAAAPAASSPKPAAA